MLSDGTTLILREDYHFDSVDADGVMCRHHGFLSIATDDGTLVDRVELPSAPTIVGLDESSVYLTGQDGRTAWIGADRPALARCKAPRVSLPAARQRLGVPTGDLHGRATRSDRATSPSKDPQTAAARR